MSNCVEAGASCDPFGVGMASRRSLLMPMTPSGSDGVGRSLLMPATPPGSAPRLAFELYAMEAAPLVREQLR